MISSLLITFCLKSGLMIDGCCRFPELFLNLQRASSNLDFNDRASFESCWSAMVELKLVVVVGLGEDGSFSCSEVISCPFYILDKEWAFPFQLQFG